MGIKNGDAHGGTTMGIWATDESAEEQLSPKILSGENRSDNIFSALPVEVPTEHANASVGNDESLAVIRTVFSDFVNDKRWICWRAISDGDGKVNKVPIDKNGKHASGALTSHATTLNAVIARINESTDLQLGFVLIGDGMGGIDLDACRDPATGVLADWAKAPPPVRVERSRDTRAPCSHVSSGTKSATL